MSRFLIVARGEHHDEDIWYPEVFETRDDIDPQSYFDGAVAGIESIWGDFSLVFGMHGSQFFGGGALYKKDWLLWKARDEEGSLTCMAYTLCEILLANHEKGAMPAAIEVKPC